MKDATHQASVRKLTRDRKTSVAALKRIFHTAKPMKQTKLIPEKVIKVAT